MSKIEVSEAVIIQPGDTVLVRIDQPLSDADFDKLRDRMSPDFPGVKIAFITAGQLMVYRPDEVVGE